VLVLVLVLSEAVLVIDFRPSVFETAKTF
jgi:hypothetical protein